MHDWMTALLLVRSDEAEDREAGLRQILEAEPNRLADRPELVGELSSMALSPERSEPEQELAAMCLGHLQEEQALAEFARSPNSRIRSHAAAGYGYCPTDSSIFALIELLMDPVNMVRNMAERSLIRQMPLVHEVGIERLLQLLNHPEPLTHSPAARLLGLTEDARALQPLLDRAANGENWLTRMWSTKALGDLGDQAAFDALKLRLQTDEKNRVRAAAAGAIGELRHPEARAVLEAAQDDDDDGVKTAVEEALDALSQSADAETLDPFEDEQA